MMPMEDGRCINHQKSSGGDRVAPTSSFMKEPPPELKIDWVQKATAATGVRERTAYRWINGEAKPHPSAERLLKAEGLL